MGFKIPYTQLKIASLFYFDKREDVQTTTLTLAREEID